MKNIIIFVSLFSVSLCFAQTTYSYVFSPTTIYQATAPPFIGGIYAPTNYPSISEPLIAEPFALNAQVYANSNLILPAAGNEPNVFFGGDIPNVQGQSGRTPVPLFTKQTFDLSDFPIHLECEFYNRINDALYNESYFWLGHADYTNYSAFCVGTNIPREGLVFGRNPIAFAITNNYSDILPSVVLDVNNHNEASFGSWYKLEILLDVVNGDLQLVNAVVNEQCIFNQGYIIGNEPWLNDFRIAVGVDDLAKDFKITTNYSSISASISASEDSICVGECIDFTSMVADSLFCTTGNLTYSWNFPGATPSTSTQANPQNICLNSAGVSNVRLIASNGTSYDTVTLNVMVEPNAICDPNADTIFVQIDSIGLSLDSICAEECIDFSSFLSDSTMLDSNNLIYDWEFQGGTPSNSNQANPQNICFNNDGIYAVRLIINNGSSQDTADLNVLVVDCDTATIVLYDSCEIFIPDAFSPNNDQVNDEFGVIYNEEYCNSISNFNFSIYNRWGNLVFNSTDIDRKWNGEFKNKKALIDTYVWYLSYRNANRTVRKSGNVTLVR